jgi:hypothetical protein
MVVLLRITHDYSLLFNVHGSVHHINILLHIIPNRCTIHRVYFYLTTALHVSGVTITHRHSDSSTIATDNITGMYIIHYSIELIAFSAEYTRCPTTYQTRHFFNNSKTDEDIATRFEHEYIRFVRNEEECVSSVCLFRCNIFIGFRIIKEMPSLVPSGTPNTLFNNCNFSLVYPYSLSVNLTLSITV